MRLTIFIPLVYLILSLSLLFLFGGAGHGWGIEAFYYVSLPAVLLVQNTKMVVIWGLIVGILQWGIIGYLLDRFVRKR
ncbi:hypothetical protein D6833_13775 [Candidatus Parcubacteria bacterium]|nr:MAG: hypothetical protein D6833_13775 [Candidatus Parcubacteria bacterium]